MGEPVRHVGHSSFNSIKVRLNRKMVVDDSLHLMFQFHKGTIKPNTQSLVKSRSCVFQFHKGTIKPFKTFASIEPVIDVSIP